jgi:cytoskeletal protein RodZ
LLEIAPAPIRAEAAATEPGSSVAPEAGEATAAVPDDGEAAASAVAPEAGDEGAAPDEKSDSMEAAATPSAEIPSESAAPTVEAASGGSQPNAEGQAEAGKNALGTVQPSVFVNMRDAPSSSAPVLGVIAKGATLPVLDRKHGWVQVTDPESGKQGWIYRGLLVGEAKPDQRIRRVAPPDAAPKSESFWGRMGRWLTLG